MTHRCLIVDDEAPARELLRSLLEEVGGVQVVGEAAEADEALELIRSIDYDLVLLDIQMPGPSGLDLAREIRQLPQRPAIVFTTAYPDHAVEAFELEAVDYLVKPFDAERLRRAIDRALASRGEERDLGPTGAPPSPSPASPVGATPGQTRIPVQRGDRTVLVDADQVVYATASRGYSYLKLADERVLVSWSLAELEQRLGPGFFRVHRSHLVNLSHVRELIPDYRGALVLVMDDRQGSQVEVSRRQARALRQALGM